MRLNAGFSKADVTPPPHGGAMDLRVLGFWYERAKPYGEIHDPLYARAAAFEADGKIACLLSVDLIGDALGFGSRVRGLLGRSPGVPPERVLVACTHAHTTPETIRLSDHPVSEEWLAILVDRAAQAARQAVESMRPSLLSFAEAPLPGTTMNRAATYNPTGAAALDETARARYGMLDQTLRVAAARDDDGAVVGALVNFGCHPVCVQTQPVISADYPGAATSRLEERGVALFLNGACGDVNPVRMGSFDDVAWIGERVADKALELLAKTAPSAQAGKGRIRGVRRIMDLSRRQVGPADHIAREAARLEQETASMGPPDPDHPERTPHRRLFMLKEQLALARMPERIPAELHALEIGEWLLLGVPGEIVGCLADDIRRAARQHRIWIVSYANGYLGYLASRASFDADSYEALPGRWSPLAPGAGETLRDAAIQLICELED